MASQISFELSRLEELATGRLSAQQIDQLAELFLDSPKFEEVTSFIAQQPGTLLSSLRSMPKQEGSKADEIASKILHRVSELAPAHGAYDNTRSEPGNLEKHTPAPASANPQNRSTRDSGLLERLDSFEIRQVLGKGGMGTVYLADDTRLDRPVAIKTLNREIASQPGAVERFLREARTAAKIEHDHICPIYQVGEDQGIPFIAMPLLKGEPLDALMRRALPLPVSETLRIGREIALGLTVAHEAGLIHRDIKPANIWLETIRDGLPRVRILDFGLARATTEENEITALGAVIGTPAYMSPEQARGRKLDARADLWSLGVILYEMTTGKRPFTGPDVMAMLTSIAVDEPEAPRALNPQTPAELSQLIMRLLSKKAELRPESGRQVAEQLQQIRMFASQPEFEALATDETGPSIVGPSAAGLTSTSGNTWGVLDDEIPMADVPSKVPQRKKSMPVALLAAMLIFLIAGLGSAAFYLFKNKNREPDKTELETTENTKETKPAIASDETKNDLPSKFEFKQIPVGESPFDKLDPKFIPFAERADWQPSELVAVIGSQTRSTWRGASHIAMSPDGRYACTVAGEISIWDTGTQRRIGLFLDYSLGYQPSFSDDGKTLYLHASEKTNSTIDLTAKPLVRKPGKQYIPLPGNWEFQRRIENGKTLIGILYEGLQCQVAIVDVSGDQPILREKFSVLRYIDYPCFHCGLNGEVAYQSLDQKLHRASIKNSKLAQLFESTPVEGSMRGFSGKTNQILLAGKDGTVSLWDFATRDLKKTSQFKEVVSGGVDIVFSPDGRWMTSSHYDTHLWRINGTEPKLVASLETGSIISLCAISDQGTNAVVLSSSGLVRFWDLSGPDAKELSPIDLSAYFQVDANLLPTPFDPVQGRLLMNRFDPPKQKNQRRQLWSLDGAEPIPSGFLDTAGSSPALSIGHDRWLHLNDDATGSRIYRSDKGQISPESESFGGPVLAGNVSPDGKTLVISTPALNPTRLEGWDLSEDKPKQRWILSSDDYRFLSTQGSGIWFSPDHRWFASVAKQGDSHSLAVWLNTPEKPKLHSLLPIANHVLFTVAFSPDGQYLAHTGKNVGIASLLKLNAKNHVAVCDFNSDDWIFSLAFHPDGKKLSTSDHHNLTIYDIESRKSIWTCRFPGAIPWHDWAADGRHLVTHNSNMTCYVLRFSEKVSTNDPHRKVAELVLGRGGFVEILDQGKTIQIKDTKSLPNKLLRLKSLRLSILTDAPALTREELALLEPIDSLQSSTLKGKITQANLVSLAGLSLAKTVRQIELTGDELTDDVFIPLSRFKSLADLTIASPRISSRGVRQLKGFPLASLTLSNASSLRDEDLAYLRDLPKLTSLNLENSALGDAGLRHIGKVIALNELIIGGCDRVTNAGIAELVNCRELTRLDFHSSATTAACLESIGKLTNLVRLNNGDLDKSTLTPNDAELAKLAGLLKLETLTLRPTNLTDASVDTLAKFKSLNSLNLTGSRMSAEGVQRLQSALPKCKIFWEKATLKK